MRVQLRDGSITTRQVTVAVNPGNPLAGSRWTLATFSSGQPLEPGAPPTLELNVGNLAQGFGGCNSFSAAYSVSAPSSIAFSVSGRGFVSCGPELDAQENLYLDTLNRVASFVISGNQLIMSDAAGQETLRFIGR
jgi:heat shock protein HslJ